MRSSLLLLASLIALLIAAPDAEAARKPSRDTLAWRIARYAPTTLTADLSTLSAGDRKALPTLVEAARLLEPLYLRQVWAGNPALERRLTADPTPPGRQLLKLFQIHRSPWSGLEAGRSFVPGAPATAPAGAGFYPEDMAKAEFEAWSKGLTETGRAAATGYYHVIRRGPDGQLRAVPYAEEYREFLEPAARLLRRAASETDNPSLGAFLRARAAALSSNDYYASDVAWMELDAPLDITFGPYETYGDELFGYKAAFEAFVTLRDDQETAKLTRYSSCLQELEDNLPMEPRYRNPKVGAMAPIRVVREVFASGDANRAGKATAFNLPNDERVVREKGAKRVMIKNVLEAKFAQMLVPIAKLVLPREQQDRLSSEAFFTHVLAHELCHGLGPQECTVKGAKSTPRGELKDLYSAIEEAKADVTGLWAVDYLATKGIVGPEVARTLYATYLAGAFRSVRFGLGEAHGKAVAVQFNWLSDHGAFRASPARGTFTVDETKVKDAVRELARLILTIEAEGDYAGAKRLFDTYAVVRPPMQKVLDRLTDLPVDILAVYPLAQ